MDIFLFFKELVVEIESKAELQSASGHAHQKSDIKMAFS